MKTDLRHFKSKEQPYIHYEQNLKLDWKEIFIVHSHKSLQDVLDAQKEVFAEGLGTFKSVTAAFHVDPTATPQFHKARPLPYTLMGKVEQVLERLQSQGVIEPV